MNSNPIVLIVDDSSASRDTITALLAGDPYLVYSATDGPDALVKASSIRPDIILLDHMMPGMSGVEVCEMLRKDPELFAIPIVFVTALDDRASRLDAFRAGADDVITKPVDRLELRMRVRNITRLNRYRQLVESREDVSRMLTELEAAYDQTIIGWAKALEYRNAETKGHSERVTQWAGQLAARFGLDAKAQLEVRRGALLHDIGKMGVPDAILLKPGPLNPQERAIMERHPALARDMLHGISYLASSVEIPYCHHERWDGAGYPQGLAGTEIPFHARLFSVVDVFDALTSDRPYRLAWSVEAALNYISAHSGSQFDPEVVRVFREMTDSGEITAGSASRDRQPWLVS